MSEPTVDWDSRYTASEQLFGDAPSPLLVEHRALLHAGIKVLAVGDGEGRNGVWLARQGLQVLSVDLSPSALARARARADHQGTAIETRCVDILDWAWPTAAFDVVVCIFVHFPAGKKSFVHRAMVDALKPGGLLMLEAFHLDQLRYGTAGPADPEMLYSLDELESEFADCRILVLEQTETDVFRDGSCQGKGSVVHLIARREAPG